jgi:RNA polymerase sigma-70 factor (ECF subfamily)
VNAVGESDTRFEAHRSLLWALCYRMTGCAADADDLVQETIARALMHPPRPDKPIRPWLVRVAINLARDLLRSRRRQGYVGPWLPSPVDDEQLEAPDLERPESRYGQLESASSAFLLALEVLTPLQRSVLLLREVFDYSIRETAETLSLTEGSVKLLQHRARKAMAHYDLERAPPTAEQRERTRQTLESFMMAMLGRDPAAIESLMREQAKLRSDGGGIYRAARLPLFGSDAVTRFLLGVFDPTTEFWVEWVACNGLPALAVQVKNADPKLAPRYVLSLEVDRQGLVRELKLVLTPRKLTAVHFGEAA